VIVVTDCVKAFPCAPQQIEGNFRNFDREFRNYLRATVCE
jgi:hypothetical protein